MKKSKIKNPARNATHSIAGGQRSKSVKKNEKRVAKRPKRRTLTTKKVVRKRVKKISIPTTIRFEASEFPYYSKNREWALAILLFGTAVGVLAYWYKMWLLLIVIVLALFVIFQNANKRPKKLQGRVDETEIQFGEIIYPLVNYRSFWISPDKNESQLYLYPIKKFSNHTHIQIPNDRAIEIHQKLLSIIPEEQSMGNAIVSKINHWFRF
jgi:hypothetical protein